MFKQKRRVSGGTASKLYAGPGRAVLLAGVHPVQESAVAVMPPKSKRPVYGKDTGNFKVVTKNVYDFNVVTCASELPFKKADGTITVPPLVTSDVAVQYPRGPADGTYDNYYHDLRAREPVKFYTMNTRVPRGGSFMSQENTLQAMGAVWAWSEQQGNLQDPYRRTFLSFKLDANGFNCCDPKQFAENCQKFKSVKQGPSAMTFYFTDPPMGNAAVKRHYSLQGTSQAYGLPTLEERTVGSWQYIIIPPRGKASVHLPNLHGKENWDKLIEMGFKPRTVGKSVRIYCSNAGIDEAQQEYVLKQTEAAPATENPTNVVMTIDGGVLVQKAEVAGHIRKPGYVDTERACQYYTLQNSDPLDSVRNLARLNQFIDLRAQGYPCVPFGSAIVFCFATFHGGTVANATRLNIPIEIHVDSFTKFRGNDVLPLDLDQLGKNRKIGSE